MKAVVLIFFLCLFGCASNAPPPLDTQEFFTSRVSEGGETQFAFGLTWQGDPSFMQEQRESISKPQRALDNRQLNTANRDRRSNKLDNQRKLALEDEAADKLQAQIHRRDLCKNGHKVEQVVWEVGRIRLMGHCL